MKFALHAALLVLLAFTAGCAGTALTLREWDRHIESLEVGMSTDEIMTRLGDPREIHPAAPEGDQPETWIYSHPRTVQRAPRYLGAREVIVSATPGEEPVLVSESVYSDGQELVVEELHLLWSHGQLLEWRRETRE